MHTHITKNRTSILSSSFQFTWSIYKQQNHNQHSQHISTINSKQNQNIIKEIKKNRKITEMKLVAALELSNRSFLRIGDQIEANRARIQRIWIIHSIKFSTLIDQNQIVCLFKNEINYKQSKHKWPQKLCELWWWIDRNRYIVGENSDNEKHKKRRWNYINNNCIFFIFLFI